MSKMFPIPHSRQIYPNPGFVLRWIKTSQLDVNKRHALGWTALHVAVINENIEYLIRKLETV